MLPKIVVCPLFSLFSRVPYFHEAKAPKNSIDPILEFKEYSWKPLSGYVHGGLHAIERHSKGYPKQKMCISLLKIFQIVFK